MWQVKMESYNEEKNVNAYFKSFPVDEYHLPQMNSEKGFFGCEYCNFGKKTSYLLFLNSKLHIIFIPRNGFHDLKIVPSFSSG
jgi:hypothetical protein